MLGYKRASVHGVFDESSRASRTSGATAPTCATRSTGSNPSSPATRSSTCSLRNSLVSAERAADELRAQAGKEADTIVEEARLRAREIAAEGQTERERTLSEIRRLKGLEAEMRASYRAFLTLALDRLDSDTQPQHAPGQAA